MNIAIAAYGPSNSARALKESLEALGHRVSYRHPDMSRIRTNRTADLVINWGISNIDNFNHLRFVSDRSLNISEAVNRAANKFSAFRAMNGEVSIPDFTTSRADAERWIRQGHRVYCRTQLRGNSGDGIVVARSPEQMVSANLYVKGLDVAHEFRFHVMNGVVIDAVRKSWREDVPEEERNMDVRNHANGSVFVRGSRSLERALQDPNAINAALSAVNSLGLDFGAVDLVLTEQGEYKVLEVNTACGLEGTTLERYTQAFHAVLTGNLPETVANLTETTQEERTVMNLSQGRPGLQVIFNPTNSRIQSLTAGNQYTIESVGRTVFRVRGDDGQIRGYNPIHFTPAAPEAPAAPAAPRVVPEPEGCNTSVPQDDPRRIIELDDGTYTNPTGTVIIGEGVQQLPEGTEVTVERIGQGETSLGLFVGILYQDNLYFLPKRLFSNGTTSGINLDPNAPAPVIARDSNGRRLNTGNHVVVLGGSASVAAGTLGTVASITEDSVTVTKESGGTVNISAERLRFLTPSDYQLRISRREALQQQENTNISIGNSNYRVLSRDLPAIKEMVRRFSV